jgi:peptide-methionine (S)-S-oxide reductase
MPGVVRTRVGYTGGSAKNPTYHNLGDHTESLQIEFDPAQTSYAKLLAVFWATHNHCAQPWSRQYQSVVFYHDETQRKLALETREQHAAQRGAPITTEILPAEEFYQAEDYHQKYFLRQNAALMRDFRAMLPNQADFIASTAAARVNGYLGGFGTAEQLAKEIGNFGLSPEGREKLQKECQRLR